MIQLPRTLLLMSLLGGVAGCAPQGGFHRGFPTGFNAAPQLATPDGNSGVVLLNIPGTLAPFAGTGFIGLKLIQMEHPATAQGDMGRVLGYSSVSVQPNWPGGFTSAHLVQGTYIIRAFDVPYKGFCFTNGTVAFTVQPATFTDLGTLNAAAYLTRLNQTAEADTTRTATYTGPDGHAEFAAHTAIDQSPDGLLAPSPADVQAATAYLDGKLGAGSVVTAAAYTPVTPLNIPQNGVDACGAVPHTSANAALLVHGVTATTLDVEGLFPKATTNPYRNPTGFIKGLNFTAIPNSATTYLFALPEDAVYMDSTCHVTSKSNFLAPAAVTQNLLVQFTTYQGVDNARWAPPHLRLFHRFTSDPPNCRYVISGQ